jgi:membrane associated rhomboid family serine protease
MEMNVTLIIVIITVGVSLLTFNNNKLMEDLIFNPVKITYKKQFYRFVTSGFIHADYIHLAFNMLSLYSFGGFVEEAFKGIFGDLGIPLYVALYLISLVVCLLPTYFKHKNDSTYLGLGASGAVSAVVFAGLLLAPTVEVGLFIIPPIIPGFIFGPIYLLISAYLDKKGQGNINHSAHIHGALFGLLFIILMGFVVARYPVIENCIQQIKWYLQQKGVG